MRRRASRVVVLLAIGVAFGPWVRGDGAGLAEQQVSRWNPAEEDRYSPPECIRAKSLRLEGLWTSGGEWNRTDLRFTPNRRGGFDVAFATSWVGIDMPLEWRLKRTARVRDGAVVLNRAVAEIGGIYRRLWPLEVGPYRTVALVPTVELDSVRRAYAAGGCGFFSAAFECHACFEQRPASLKNP